MVVGMLVGMASLLGVGTHPRHRATASHAVGASGTATDAAATTTVGHKVVPERLVGTLARSITGRLAGTTAAAHGAAPMLRRAAAVGCTGAYRHVAGQGRSCPVLHGMWKVLLPGGGAVITHGADPRPNTWSGGTPTTPPAALQSNVVCADPAEHAFRLVYILPAGEVDNYAAKTSQIRDLVYQASGFVDAEAQQVDPTRHMRLKVRCDGAGLPLVSKVTLSAGQGFDFDTITAALAANGYGSSLDDVVGFEEGTPDSRYGGQGTFWPDSQPGPANTSDSGGSYALVYRTPSGWGWEAALHEITHNMGGVQDDAPFTSLYGHCTDGQDVMCYPDGGANQGLFTQHTAGCEDRDHYDCNGNTYFNPLPAPASYLSNHWNIAHPNNHWLRISGTSDTTAPTATVVQPQPLKGAARIAVAAQDDVQVGLVQVTLDAGTANETVLERRFAPWDVSLPTASPTWDQDSSHTVSVQAWDTSGNASVATAPLSFVVDRTVPGKVVASSIANGTSGSVLWNGSRSVIKFRWSAVADPRPDLSTVVYRYCVVDAPYGCTPDRTDGISVNGALVTVTTPNMYPPLIEDNATLYSVCVTSADTAGNASTLTCQTATGQKVDITPPPTPIVRDGNSQGSDTGFTDPNSISANWNFSSDATKSGRAGSGLGGYEWCVATSLGCTSGVLYGWAPPTGSATALTATASGLGLLEGVTYYVCARSHDNVGNVSQVGCSNGQVVDLAPPPAPATVYDGTSGSQEPVVTAPSAWWSTVTDPSGIDHYEWCSAAAATCTNFSGNGVTVNGASATATAAIGSFTDGATLHVCVRAVDGAGRAGAATCSSGAQLDATAPAAPGKVIDGPYALDVDATLSTTQLDVSWTAAANGSIAIDHYDWCITSVDPCDIAGVHELDWTNIGTDLTATWVHALTLNALYVTCVRAVDGFNRSSPPTCSNGVRVVDQLPAPPVAPTAVLDGAGPTDAAWLRSTTTVSLSWAPVDGIPNTNYQTCVSTLPACAGTVVSGWAPVTPTVLNFRRYLTITGLALSNGSSYFSCVRAIDAMQQLGSPACSNGQRLDTLAPSVATTLRASSLRRTSVVISWHPSTDNIRVVSYVLQRRSGTRWITVSTAATYKRPVKALRPHTVYVFRVIARDAAGNASAPSRTVSIRTRR